MMTTINFFRVLKRQLPFKNLKNLKNQEQSYQDQLLLQHLQTMILKRRRELMKLKGKHLITN